MFYGLAVEISRRSEIDLVLSNLTLFISLHIINTMDNHTLGLITSQMWMSFEI